MGISALGKRVFTSFLDGVDNLKGVNRAVNLVYLIYQTCRMVPIQRVEAWITETRLTNLTLIVNIASFAHRMSQYSTRKCHFPESQWDFLVQSLKWGSHLFLHGPDLFLIFSKLLPYPMNNLVADLALGLPLIVRPLRKIGKESSAEKQLRELEALLESAEKLNWLTMKSQKLQEIQRNLNRDVKIKIVLEELETLKGIISDPVKLQKEIKELEGLSEMFIWSDAQFTRKSFELQKKREVERDPQELLELDLFNDEVEFFKNAQACNQTIDDSYQHITRIINRRAYNKIQNESDETEVADIERYKKKCRRCNFIFNQHLLPPYIKKLKYLLIETKMQKNVIKIIESLIKFINDEVLSYIDPNHRFQYLKGQCNGNFANFLEIKKIKKDNAFQEQKISEELSSLSCRIFLVKQMELLTEQLIHCHQLASRISGSTEDNEKEALQSNIHDAISSVNRRRERMEKNGINAGFQFSYKKLNDEIDNYFSSINDMTTPEKETKSMVGKAGAAIVSLVTTQSKPASITKKIPYDQQFIRVKAELNALGESIQKVQDDFSNAIQLEINSLKNRPTWRKYGEKVIPLIQLFVGLSMTYIRLSKWQGVIHSSSQKEKVFDFAVLAYLIGNIFYKIFYKPTIRSYYQTIYIKGFSPGAPPQNYIIEFFQKIYERALSRDDKKKEAPS